MRSGGGGGAQGGEGQEGKGARWRDRGGRGGGGGERHALKTRERNGGGGASRRPDALMKGGGAASACAALVAEGVGDRRRGALWRRHNRGRSRTRGGGRRRSDGIRASKRSGQGPPGKRSETGDTAGAATAGHPQTAKKGASTAQSGRQEAWGKRRGGGRGGLYSTVEVGHSLGTGLDGRHRPAGGRKTQVWGPGEAGQGRRCVRVCCLLSWVGLADSAGLR